MKSMEMEIGFSMEPADRGVGIMGEGFGAWLLKGTTWCNMTNFGAYPRRSVPPTEHDTTFEWFDNESGDKVAPPTEAVFVEAALWAFASAFYADQEEAYGESGDETENDE